jgi:D-threonate/D-erythronate kinase
MTALRLLADDLTGALDTAAEFVGMTGPVPVFWAGAIPPDLARSSAVDSGTRELHRTEAISIVGTLSFHLSHADIAYKKVDSLLRGHPYAELTACFRLGEWRHCVFAPAFPYQGRVTYRARQFVRQLDGSWSPVSGDLIAEIAAEGLPVQRTHSRSEMRPGVNVFDAATEEDLDAVVTAGRSATGSVLWCGSGGLARAMARGTDANQSTLLQRPILGLFGSDQEITSRQLAACEAFRVRWPPGALTNAAALSKQLNENGVALVSIDLPPGLSRAEATERIQSGMEDVTRSIGRPRTLLVAGGETLRGLCISLSAEHLEVRGQVIPGLPRSVLRGGRWDGVEVISKSGAFGSEGLWRNLLEDNGIEIEG